MLKNFPNKRNLMVIAVLAVSVLPLFKIYRLSTESRSGFQSMRPVEVAMAWLRGHSPQVPHYLDPETKPDSAYSVFSPDWAIGHFIIYRSHRPVVATPFGGTQKYEIGIEACVLGMLTEKEDVFYAICQQFKSRYVVCQGLRVVSPAALQLIYKDFTGKTVATKTDNSFYYRLFGWNNWRTEKLDSPTNGFQHFRLIYNSRFALDGTASALRIYEVVPGAHVHVQLPTNQHHFTASISLTPGFGKPILYRVDLEPDASGHAAFLCPFSTDTNGDVRAISKLEIHDMETGSVVARSPVSSEAVQEGLSVNIVCEEKLGPVREEK
ncbi:MAG: hypothetical protein GXO70_08550 [Acidobacteria bacterium]|nr:hypothetical protein [Acidobacteriota bacterium]